MNPLEFGWNVLVNVLGRIAQEIEELPERLYRAFLDAWNSITWIDVVTGPISNFGNILVKFGVIPFDELQNFLMRLQRIPTKAVVEEAKKVIAPNMPHKLTIHVMKCSDAVLFCADVIGEAAINSAQLQIPGSARFLQRVKSIASKVGILINGLPFAKLVKKLVEKVWLIVIEAFLLAWNYGLLFWSVLTLLSLISRTFGPSSATENYQLRQTNKLVQDTELGRKRLRR